MTKQSKWIAAFALAAAFGGLEPIARAQQAEPLRDARFSGRLPLWNEVLEGTNERLLVNLCGAWKDPVGLATCLQSELRSGDTYNAEGVREFLSAFGNLRRAEVDGGKLKKISTGMYVFERKSDEGTVFFEGRRIGDKSKERFRLFLDLEPGRASIVPTMTFSGQRPMIKALMNVAAGAANRAPISTFNCGAQPTAAALAGCVQKDMTEEFTAAFGRLTAVHVSMDREGQFSAFWNNDPSKAVDYLMAFHRIETAFAVFVPQKIDGVIYLVGRKTGEARTLIIAMNLE